MPNIYIGTSGWNYKHWRDDVFYPTGLPQKKWLSHYVQFYNIVELNVTFYRLVPKTTFQKWYKETPGDFLFVAKGSRYITHIKRLKDVKGALHIFLKNVAGLKKKLSCILWQLPPSSKKDLKRLEAFLKLLPAPIRQVFEFRHLSWFDAEVYALLKAYNACLCIASGGPIKTIKEVTADFIYLRFHGLQAIGRGYYTDAELKTWARFVKTCQPRDAYAFFNNDLGGYAIQNSLTFKKYLKA
jgi:uncharacterized protein YecE (DUF72 family)